MTHIVFTDLDDTLFSSKEKQNTDSIEQVTQSTNGRHSYVNEKQNFFFQMLKTLGMVVPVTTRGSDSFDRVSLNFGHNCAVLANGAIIRNKNGVVNQMWFEQISEISQKRQKDLTEMKKFVISNYGEKVWECLYLFQFYTSNAFDEDL